MHVWTHATGQTESLGAVERYRRADLALGLAMGALEGRLLGPFGLGVFGSRRGGGGSYA
jgi:hypothetical protein